MQTYYVDLSSSTSGSGTSADPFSWADVRAKLASIPDSVFDMSNTFDSGRAFDGSVVDIVFRCRGRGDILNQENAVSLSNLDFSSISGGLRFVADDPGRYGLPIIGTATSGTELTAGTSWFKLINGRGVRLDFTGFVFDINGSFGHDGYNLLEISGGSSATTNFSKNVVIDRGAGHCCVYVHGTDAGSRTVTVGNTLCYCAASTGIHEFTRANTSSLFTGLNYTVQSSLAKSIVLFTQAAGALYTHANAFSLRASSLVYTGVAAKRYGSDVVGIDQPTQGVYGFSALLASGADLSDISGGLVSKLTYSESCKFWPIHAGRLLALGTATIPAVLDLGMTETDAFGYQRSVLAQDAGAFQKSKVSVPETVHVDLAVDTTGGNGTETEPIGIVEFQSEYARRAPVDYQLTYVLRNNNVASPLTSFDFGPTSPNAAAADTTYAGAGSIKLTGYKTYNTQLPILSAQRLVPNANLPVVVERMKLEFSSGTHFIVGSIPVAFGDFRIRACVIRSRVAAQGYFVRSAVSTSPVHLRGCTVVQEHSAGTGSGIFNYASTGSNTMHLCAVNLKNQNVLGSGAVDMQACSISTGTASAATWSGAVIDSFTNLSATNAFLDPDNADYNAANFILSSSSSAIAILHDAAAIVGDVDDLAYDCRGMQRSAYPNGSKAADAGAYEYDFYTPEPTHRYLDLGKVRTGIGSQTDKWGPADFQAWCDSLQGTVLDRTVVVHTSRSGFMDLVLRDVDADPNGTISLVADGATPLWESAVRGNLTVVDSSGITIQIRKLMLRNETGAAVAWAHGCTNMDLDVVNSIIDNKRKQTAYTVTLTEQPDPSSVLTVTVPSVSGPATWTFRSGTDFVNGATLVDTAAAIAAAINASNSTTASAASNTITVVAPNVAAGDAVSGTGDFVVAAVVAIVDVDTAVVRGCSFNDEFESESGLQTVAVKAATAHVGYTAFQGHAFSGTTRTLVAVQATAGTGFDNRSNAYNTVASGVTDTGSVSVATQLFAQLRAPDTDVASFEISALELLDVVSVPALPAVFAGPDVETDILSRYRSQVYMDPTKNLFDVGAVERNYLNAEAIFTGDVTDPITELTDVGYSLNARALTGDFGFTLSGYALTRRGYVYWDPTKPQPVQDPGSQAHAILRVASLSFVSDTVTVTSALGSTAVQVGDDFDIGSTVEETALAIASALRANAGFNSAFWILVDGANLHIYSWRYGTASAGNNVVVTGTAITRTQNFVTGVEPLGVQDQVYPVSGYSPWYGTAKPDPRSLGFIVRLEAGTFVYGELVVIASVARSAFAGEVGTEYVYARVRMPISTKHSRRTLVQRVLLAY